MMDDGVHSAAIEEVKKMLMQHLMDRIGNLKPGESMDMHAEAPDEKKDGVPDDGAGDDDAADADDGTPDSDGSGKDEGGDEGDSASILRDLAMKRLNSLVKPRG